MIDSLYVGVSFARGYRLQHEGRSGPTLPGTTNVHQSRDTAIEALREDLSASFRSARLRRALTDPDPREDPHCWVEVEGPIPGGPIMLTYTWPSGSTDVAGAVLEKYLVS
jgi:hypothetical protein